MTSRSKRPDIQYLRAIAVLLVVLYHAGFDSFRNGFLGVDIFFVVSGYLMATLYSNVATGEFFLKRIRRLAPSFGFVSLTALLISFGYVTPFQFKEISKEIILGITGTSNLYFWNQDTYFAPGAFRPFLHLWTLSLELQFYLIFPLISRFSKGKKWPWITLLAISFGLSQLILYKSPKTSFFLLPTRLWEFAFGVLAASLTQTLISTGRRNRRILVILSFVGIATPFLLRINPDSTSGLTGHPGISALLVTVSTALLLSLRINLGNNVSVLSRLLLSVGNSSYAIYLIHYPLFVAINYAPFQPSRTHIDNLTLKLLVVLCAVILGILLTNKFEKAILTRKLNAKTISVAAAVLVVICLGLIPINKSIAPTTIQNISQSVQDRGVYRCGKAFRILNPISNVCEIFHSLESKASRVLLLGNSHADAIKAEMVNVARAEKFNLYFWANNNPFTNSNQELAMISNEVENFEIDVVVLHSSYSYPKRWEIEELIRLTEKLGTKFYMIESVPTYLESVPILEFRKFQGEEVTFTKLVNPESMRLVENYSEIDSRRFKYILSHQAFCKVECIWGTTQGKLYYFDSNHLTLTGAKRLNSVLKEINYNK